NLQKSMDTSPDTSPEEKAVWQPALSQAKGAGVWVTVEGGQVKINLGLLCGDAGSASQVTGSVQKSWDKQKANLSGLLVFVAAANVQNLANELINSMKFTTQGSLSLASTQASVDITKKALTEGKKMAESSAGLPQVGGPPTQPNGRPAGGQPGRPAPGGRQP